MDKEQQVEWARRYLVANCQSFGKSEIGTNGGKSGWGIALRTAKNPETGAYCVPSDKQWQPSPNESLQLLPTYREYRGMRRY
jgi:hypothetical protein